MQDPSEGDGWGFWLSVLSCFFSAPGLMIPSIPWISLRIMTQLVRRRYLKTTCNN